MSVKRSEPWLERTIALARGFTEGHPSDVERDEALNAIDAMIRELQRIRDHLASLPSEVERRRITEAAATMEQFLDSMRARPAVALAMGLGDPKTSALARLHKAPTIERRHEEPDVLLSELEKLSTEEIQSRLLNEHEFPVSQLQAVARKLGLPTDRTKDRLDLVDRIVKLGFANKRGHELLGGARRVAR